MATVILFAIAVLCAIAIGRYNEDDRLFWKSLGALTVAFTIATVAQSMSNATEKYDTAAITSITTTQPTITAVDSNLAIPAVSTGYEAEKVKQEWPYAGSYGNYNSESRNHTANARGQPCCNHNCICNKGPINKVGIQDDS